MAANLKHYLLITQENGKLTAILYDATTAVVDTWTANYYDASILCGVHKREQWTQ